MTKAQIRKIDNLNRTISIKDFESIFNIFPKIKTPVLGDFTDGFLPNI